MTDRRRHLIMKRDGENRTSLTLAYFYLFFVKYRWSQKYQWWKYL